MAKKQIFKMARSGILARVVRSVDIDKFLIIQNFGRFYGIGQNDHI